MKNNNTKTNFIFISYLIIRTTITIILKQQLLFQLQLAVTLEA